MRSPQHNGLITVLATALVALAAVLLPGAAHARGDCLGLAAQAEREFAIPAGILQAIALTESGGDGPWILNAAGTPLVLPDRAAAVRATYGAMLRFGDDVAIGCMQLHMHWHERYFNSIDEVVDPAINVRYAAMLLVSLRRSYGSWVAAVERYHSSDPAAERTYLCRVVQYRAALGYQAAGGRRCGAVQ